MLSGHILHSHLLKRPGHRLPVFQALHLEWLCDVTWPASIYRCISTGGLSGWLWRLWKSPLAVTNFVYFVAIHFIHVPPDVGCCRTRYVMRMTLLSARINLHETRPMFMALLIFRGLVEVILKKQKVLARQSSFPTLGLFSVLFSRCLVPRRPDPGCIYSICSASKKNPISE